MKTILLILPLAGAALLASAAEPVKPETPGATTTLSASKDAVSPVTTGLTAADKASDAKFGEKIARSGELKTKPKVSVTRSFAQSLNPFAPMKPAPTTPWVSRAAWSTVATTEHESVSSSPGATNRELKFKVVVWRD